MVTYQNPAHPLLLRNVTSYHCSRFVGKDRQYLWETPYQYLQRDLALVLSYIHRWRPSPSISAYFDPSTSLLFYLRSVTQFVGKRREISGQISLVHAIRTFFVAYIHVVTNIIFSFMNLLLDTILCQSGL